MNKGLKLRFCKECGRKRFCKSDRVTNYNLSYICSKGHHWIVETSRFDKINMMSADMVLPTIKELFNRDNIFFKMLRNK